MADNQGRDVFKDLYLCEFVLQPDPLVELAAEYHARCEAYDVTVCSGSREGVAAPTTYRELGLINRNAMRVIADIVARTGCDRHALMRAIQKTDTK